MKTTTRIQLSLMMFLEFFIWGGWFVTMGTYLSQAFSASGGQLAMAYETQSIGAIVAPFIIGLIADRYFSAQKNSWGTAPDWRSIVVSSCGSRRLRYFLSLHSYLYDSLHAHTSPGEFCGFSSNARPL